MGSDYSRSFTEAGVKHLYQYFIINVLYLFFSYILILTFIAVITSITSLSVTPFTGLSLYRIFFSTILFIFSALTIWIVFDGMLRICWGLSFFIGILLTVMEFIIILILLFLLIWGISYLLFGRKEFGKKHQIFVIVGFCLSIVYFILFIVNLILAGTMANLALSFNIYTSLNLFSQIKQTAIIISIVLTFLANSAFVLFIFNLSQKKKLLITAFILGILAPFTFSSNLFNA